MPPIDLYHIIAVAMGVLLKLLWEKFVGPAPANANFSNISRASAAQGGFAGDRELATSALVSLLDNQQALQLLRELLHATPPPPASPRP